MSELNLYTVKLGVIKEPLDIHYPKDYAGSYSEGSNKISFTLSTIPRTLTKDEVIVANEYLTKLPYKQFIVNLKTVKVHELDALLQDEHLDLDNYEAAAKLPCTKHHARLHNRVHEIRANELDKVLGKK